MIIYIVSNDCISKLVLPIKIMGVYPVYAPNKKFLGNVESNEEHWYFKLDADVSSSKGAQVLLENFTSLNLKSSLMNMEYDLFTIPTYDENAMFMVPQKKEISIGISGDISYRFANQDYEKGITKLVYNGEYWTLQTNMHNIFLNDSIVKNTRIYNGDYLFLYGLKIIIFNQLFVISNPNHLVTLAPGTFTSYSYFNQATQGFPPLVGDDTPLFSSTDYFFKAPRFDQPIQTQKVVISEPPAPVKENDTPIILTVGPQLTMVCTSVLSLVSYITMFMQGQANLMRFLVSLGTVSITITGALLWPNLTRKLNNKRIREREAKRQEKYKEYLNKKREEILGIQEIQKQILFENTSSPENCKTIIDTRQRVLWQRSITDEDFLQIRLGIGNVDTKIDIEMPAEEFSLEEEDNLLLDLKNIIQKSLKIEGVPLNVSLLEHNITAILGIPELTKQFTDNVFLQLMTFHAYTDLKFVVFTNDKNKWDYLKIAPHTWDNHKNMRYFGTNSEEIGLITAEIEKVFDDRIANESEEAVEDNGLEKENENLYKNFKPYYLIFTDDISTSRNNSLIKKILNYKKNVGFSILILNDKLANLPSETSTFINIDKGVSGLVTNELSVNNQYQFQADLFHNIDIYECAKKLANIPISIQKEKYELPSSLSFLELYGVGKVEQLNCLERWSTNNPVNSLAVPIGVDQNGETFKMDIHEKAFGPHGLVAGTTGSGKSEWIVTYILSLAVNFHPDEVQFVLIDYKGGGLAMSFENQELGIKLPHLAGTITNLDKSEINRCIASIESELKRRQNIFNQAREKLKEGSMNIYKYQQFYRKGMVEEPLSHLILICDEFAELKQQQPEFMEQLISTSRIGRSLGVHLILATQKPSGVVNDQIWSNSKFKVCLKVQDKGDSNEILKKPDAAFLKQTGAFYISVGNDDYYNLGQAAWAGAKYFPSDVMRKTIDQSVVYINNIGQAINSFDDESLIEQKSESKGEELLNIVQYIDKVSKSEVLKGRQLWLPNIAPILYLNDLIQKYHQAFTAWNFTIPIGEYDEPREQKQGLLQIDLAKGNVAIIGQSGSGKEELLSTILWTSMIQHTPYEINHYILDFGAETLKKFAKFPHVGEVVFQDEMERVAGVVQLVLDEIEDRKNLFSDFNGSFEYYNKMNQKKKPLIVLSINAYDVFEETIPKLVELITTLFRDAPRYGVIFLVTVSSSTAIRSRQLQYFNHVILLNLQDEASYRSITNCRRGLIPGKYKGRGICRVGDDDDSYAEFQTAKIAPDEMQIDYLRKVADQFVAYYKCKAKQLAKIPDNVTSTDLIPYITGLDALPIGYRFYEKDIAKFNFLQEKIYFVSSKELKNHMKFIYALASILTKVPNVKVRVLDFLDMFKQPILDIKLFQDNFDTVVAALENDVIHRTTKEDYAVNIILGAGDFKKKLSKGGVEIFQNMMSKIPQSNKIIFLFIDHYDSLKLLKLESWYSMVNTTKGIWLGTGFSSQSIFQSNEMLSDDKKYEFEGLAFTIDDAKYTLIKTMMDGDE